MQKKTKIIIAVVAAIVVAGGIVGTVLGVNAYNEKKEKEAVVAFLQEMDKARTNAVNAYNDRVNQIVTSLDDLNANSDVTAMTNAVNELNNVTNDVNNDVLITQEQKDALNGNIANQVNAINARINAVNEANANAQAEAERQAAQAQAKKNEQAKASTGSSSKKSGGSTGSNNGGNTGNSDSSNGGNTGGSVQAEAPAQSSASTTRPVDPNEGFIKDVSVYDPTAGGYGGW